jgi:hypothetical protein
MAKSCSNIGLPNLDMLPGNKQVSAALAPKSFDYVHPRVVESKT